MMDIFTILVFFLLVNSSDVEELPSAKDIVLPDSTAEEKAHESVVVLLTDTQVLVQGRAVAEIAAVNASDALIIPALKIALEEQAGRSDLGRDGRRGGHRGPRGHDHGRPRDPV